MAQTDYAAKYKTLLIQVADGGRNGHHQPPESRNAINADMFGELLTIWDDLSADRDIRSSC